MAIFSGPAVSCVPTSLYPSHQCRHDGGVEWWVVLALISRLPARSSKEYCCWRKGVTSEGVSLRSQWRRGMTRHHNRRNCLVYCWLFLIDPTDVNFVSLFSLIVATALRYTLHQLINAAHTRPHNDTHELTSHPSPFSSLLYLFQEFRL